MNREDVVVQVAELHSPCTTLGPGVRSVLWVQGCPFRCPGCVAPDWIPFGRGQEMPASTVASLLIAEANVSGITISGGEPMMQAEALCVVIDEARRSRALNVICFTGFTLKSLRRRSRSSPVHRLLDRLDVLIDGEYVEALNDGRGLRGSSNQKIHFLTEALLPFKDDMEFGNRKTELKVGRESILMVGVPAPGAVTALNRLSKPKGD